MLFFLFLFSFFRKCVILKVILGDIMKLLMMKNQKDFEDDRLDGYILPLANFSVSYPVKYHLDEICALAQKKEVFVLLNKPISNQDITSLEEVLKQLDQSPVKGVFFYDLSVLSIVQRLHLSLPLIWNQTHMVTNYNTIRYYQQQGAAGAVLANELTLSEMFEIRQNTTATLFANIVYQPVVSFSKRHLITNYFQSFQQTKKKEELTVQEPKSHQTYQVLEEEDGTTFVYAPVINGSRPCLSMMEAGFDYGIIDVRKKDPSIIIHCLSSILKGNHDAKIFSELDEAIGKNTGFFYRKSIYKVK